MQWNLPINTYAITYSFQIYNCYLIVTIVRIIEEKIICGQVLTHTVLLSGMFRVIIYIQGKIRKKKQIHMKTSLLWLTVIMKIQLG